MISLPTEKITLEERNLRGIFFPNKTISQGEKRRLSICIAEYTVGESSTL